MEAEISGYSKNNGYELGVYIVKLPRIKVGDCTYKNVYRIAFTSDIQSGLSSDYAKLKFKSLIYVRSIANAEAVKNIVSLVNHVAVSKKEVINILGIAYIETINISKYIELVEGYHDNDAFINGQLSVYTNELQSVVIDTL